MSRKLYLSPISFLTALGVMSAMPTQIAQAHHSFAIYDLDNPIEITGKLTKLQFRNPHTILVVEVDGKELAVEWNIESMNPRRWDSADIPRDLAAIGDIVTIKGWPAANGAATMALGTVVSPKGTTIVRDRIRQGEGEGGSGRSSRSDQSTNTSENGMANGGMGSGMGNGGMGGKNRTQTTTEKSTDANTSKVAQAAPSMTVSEKSTTATDIAADLSLLPAGTYKSDDSHAYVAFDYFHQGYSKPILTWDEVDATIELNPENPEASSLTVSIPTASINSGVPIWDERLQNSTFFDAAAHPTISFNSTSLNMTSKSTGTVTGNLTIKGVSKPLTLDVTLNKVGKHFRSGKDIFGISATASLNRSDWGLTTGIPATSDNVNLRIEVEFGKE